MIKPLGTRVLVLPYKLKESDKTKSGIIIPKSSNEQESVVTQGKVLEIGHTVETKIKKGDKVLYSKFGLDEVKFEGVVYVLVPEHNLIATLEQYI